MEKASQVYFAHYRPLFKQAHDLICFSFKESAHHKELTEEDKIIIRNALEEGNDLLYKVIKHESSDTDLTAEIIGYCGNDTCTNCGAIQKDMLPKYCFNCGAKFV